MPSMGLRLLSLIPSSNLTNHVCTAVTIFVVISSKEMFQVLLCTRYLIELSFPRARLVFLLSVRVFILKEHDNLLVLRGLYWPESNERFRGVSGAGSKFGKLCLPH